ncbi:MAG TPA: heavy metal-associated domain-containing protein, partial [Saprospiraceae bacterium]|nr:heavy metal-associated domain-containing protein [Saprospiraceae bacterium]
MEKSVFSIPKMDCASEENMVRMKLDDVSGIQVLDFDIPSRKLTVIHEGNLDAIKASIDSLNFGSSLESSETLDSAQEFVESTNVQSGL